MSRRIHTVLDLAVILLYCATIFLLSSIPKFHSPVYPFENFDMVSHVVFYAGLSLVINRFLGNDLKFNAVSTMLIAVTFTIVYGILDEFHQSFVPGRSPSTGDFLANSAGAVLAAIAWYRFFRPLRRPALLILTEPDKEEDELPV